MKVRKLAAALTLVGLLALGAGSAFAHQPVLVDSEATEVLEPEISKAYFGKLLGEPHTYRIDSAVEFNLYVGILVPEDGSPKKDVAAEIFAGTELMAAIGGVGADWVTFYEPFGQNTYWDGGEYRTRAPAGVYTIKISSPDNQSKYSLAIGEIEFFDLEDRANALVVLPEIQREFFGTSPVEMVGTRFGDSLGGSRRSGRSSRRGRRSSRRGSAARSRIRAASNRQPLRSLRASGRCARRRA